jgi:hypothetical protein
MREHGSRNECLAEEIAQLGEEMYQLEVRKNREIEQVKDGYSREHKGQLDAILGNHARTVELMQLEAAKAKEMLASRENEIDCLTHELKSTSERMRTKCE